MALRKYRSLLTLLTSSFLLLLLSACNGPGLANATNSSLATSSANLTQSMSLAVSTQCPAPGTGRAAVLPPFTPGKDQNVVYVSNTYTSLASALKRYDTLTKKTTTILTLANKNIVFSQVSADGQWILFVSAGTQQSQTPNKIQLVRMDGRYLQTLYCSANWATSINSIQWSTDRKLIVFDFIRNGTQNVDVLHTTNGSIQTDLSSPKSSTYVNVRTWLDTTRIYLTDTLTDAPPNIIYLLDTKKGANQKLSNVPIVFKGTFGDFDSSYNGKNLYTSSCICGYGGNSGPGAITVMPATGGQTQTLYSSTNDAITTVRAVLPTTLLFIVYNYNSSTSDNGLWKVNTDGSGLTRFTTDPGNQSSSLNNSSQFPWSNVSRDGSTYSLLVLNGPTGSLEIGAISGGTPKTIATFGSSGPFLDFAGWTTM
jgi:eukaryotic-like serine/threonine-protein kinase